jgi:hypothetical protein
MPERTEWTHESPRRNSRVDIAGEGVLVASNCGPEGEEMGAVVSHQEFLDGKYQDVVRKVFGPQVLHEMVQGCKEIIAARVAG